MNTMNMDIDSLEDTNTFWPSTLRHRHHHHQPQHVSFAPTSPSGPSKYTDSLVHTSPLSYSYNSLDDDDEDWIPDTPLTPLTPLDRHEDDKRRVRSDSVPSLCHSASTASSPDQDDLYGFPDDDDDYEFQEGKSSSNLGQDSDVEPEDEDISPFPPSFTPPTFYYSPAPTASSSSPGCSSLLSSTSVAAQSHELSGLLNLQRRTQEDLAQIEDAVQLHSSVSNGNATILGSLKSRRKAVKEKSKEIDGLIRFGVDRLGGDSTYTGSLDDDEGSQSNRSWGSAAALLSFSPTPPPIVNPIPGFTSPPPALSLDTTSPSASSPSLLFPTLPSPSTQKSQKQKKEPPSSIDHLLSRMILGRRDQEGVKARNVLESSVGRTCGSRRQSSLTREVLPHKEMDNDEKLEAMEVDRLLPPDYVPDEQRQGQDPNIEYHEDLEMDEDEDLDELGLTGFD